MSGPTTFSALIKDLHQRKRLLMLLSFLDNVIQIKGRTFVRKNILLSGLSSYQCWPLYCLSAAWKSLEPYYVLTKTFDYKVIPDKLKYLPAEFAVGVDIHDVLHVFEKLKPSKIIHDIHLKIVMQNYLEMLDPQAKEKFLSYAINLEYVCPPNF